MFQDEQHYAKKLLVRNNIKSIESHDVVMNAYNGKSIDRKKMIDIVLVEKRRNKKEKCKSKLCSNCKCELPMSGFYLRTDYRMNFTYTIQPCKQCFKDRYAIRKMMNSEQKVHECDATDAK